MPSSTLRRLTLAGAATTAALIATGCSAVTTPNAPTAGQATPLARVRFAQTVCAATIAADGRPFDGPCAPFEAVNDFPSQRPIVADGRVRLLVALLLPEGFPAPVLHYAGPNADGTPVTFAPEPSVVTAALPTPPAGSAWVGYRSSVLTIAKGAQVSGGDVYAEVAVPRPDGRPVAQRLATQVAFGAQVVADGVGHTYPEDRPVDCAEPSQDDQIDATSCPVDPSEPVAVDATDAAVDAPAATAAVRAGDTATLTFMVEQAGRLPAGADAVGLELAAASTIPGARATPGTGALPWDVTPAPIDDGGIDGPDAPSRRQQEAPAPSTTTDVPVAVAVPAGTPTGDYDVTLRAHDAGGERTATARIHVQALPSAVVAAPPVAAPAPTAARPARVRLLRAATVGRSRRAHLGRVACRSTGACRVRAVVVVGRKRVATSRLTLKAGAERKLTLRLTRQDAARLRRAGGEVRVTITSPGATDVTRTTELAAR